MEIEKGVKYWAKGRKDDMIVDLPVLALESGTKGYLKFKTCRTNIPDHDNREVYLPTDTIKFKKIE